METGVFKKTMLRVGTYHSPDGIVEVTTDRLRRWADNFRRMTAARQVIPMHWDHGSDLDSLQPVSMDTFSARTRSAKNSVGKLADFRLTQGGNAAEVTFETLDPDATRKVSANAVYVSPVIFPEWRDGAGNTYTDCITHLDLVNHPVDHSQGPSRRVNQQPVIACALRMGLSVEPYRMGVDMDEDELELDGDLTEEGAETTDTANSDELTEVPGEADGEPGIGDLMLALADHGIVLPGDTTEGNFLDRLRTALIARKGAEPGMGDAGGAEASPAIGGSGGDFGVADPQIATMSLQARNALNFAAKTHKNTMAAQLQSLLESGRCTPVEYREKRNLLRALRLSLQSNGQPKPTELSQWIDARKSLPKGACWSGTEKLRRMSATAVNPQMSHTVTRRGEADMSSEDVDAAVAALLR